jgi:hypothetical protein
MVTLIIQNHFITDWHNGYRVKRSEQGWYINYIVDKEFEVIGVTFCLVKNEETRESESQYRIDENSVNESLFTSNYFKAMYYKSYDDSIDDLEDAVTRVNNNQITEVQYKNITKYNIVCRLLRKYYQGWSWFFYEQEYRENRYEKDDEDEGVILTQLDKLNNDLALESRFNM